MYIKPRQVFERWRIYEKRQRIDDMGRVGVEYAPTALFLMGAIGTMGRWEGEKWRQYKHGGGGVIVERCGERLAKVGDALIKESETYLITGVDEVLNQWRLWYVEQRNDLEIKLEV